MPGQAPTEFCRGVGRAFVRRSSLVVIVVMIVIVVAIVTAVLDLNLAADFAARGHRRMNVRVGGSAAQRVDEFVQPVGAGGKLLCRKGYDVGSCYCSFHRRR